MRWTSAELSFHVNIRISQGSCKSHPRSLLFRASTFTNLTLARTYRNREDISGLRKRIWIRRTYLKNENKSQLLEHIEDTRIYRHCENVSKSQEHIQRARTYPSNEKISELREFFHIARAYPSYKNSPNYDNISKLREQIQSQTRVSWLPMWASNL